MGKGPNYPDISAANLGFRPGYQYPGTNLNNLWDRQELFGLLNLLLFRKKMERGFRTPILFGFQKRINLNARYRMNLSLVKMGKRARVPVYFRLNPGFRPGY